MASSVTIAGFRLSSIREPRFISGDSVGTVQTNGWVTVTWIRLLAAKFGLSQSVGAFCLVAYTIAVFALLLLPETKGRRLDEIDMVENETDPLLQPLSGQRT